MPDVYETAEETRAGWELAQSGDMLAAATLRSTAVRLGQHFAKQYLALQDSGGYEEDCLQEAAVAALAALRGWKPGKGALSTIIAHRVKGAIRNLIDRESNNGAATKHTPRVVEHVSWDTPVTEDEDTPLSLDEITPYPEPPEYYAPPDEVTENLEEGIADEVNTVRLMNGLAALPANDAGLLRSYYGIGCVAETQQELARGLGISQQATEKKIRSIENRLRRILK